MKINLHHFLVAILCLAVPFCSFSQDDSVTFDAKYIKKNDGKVTIEVNEVQELTYIMMAISDFAVGNSDMLNRDTDYYQARLFSIILVDIKRIPPFRSSIVCLPRALSIIFCCPLMRTGSNSTDRTWLQPMYIRFQQRK